MFDQKLKETTPGALTLPGPGARRRKSILALDLEGEFLHAAAASGGRITRVASAKLDVPAEKREDATAVGIAVRKALEEMKLKAREAAVTLPRANVVLRPLQLPKPADPRELAALVNFQIARDLPFRIEDAVVDFKVLRAFEAAPTEPAAADAKSPPEPLTRLDVLVGAVKSDVVQFYRDVAKTAGLKVASLGLRAIATAHAASLCGAAPRDAALLLILLRAQEVTIDIVLEEKLVFSRVASLSLGGDDAKQKLQALEIEVVRSLHSYEGSSGFKPIGKVAVAGSTGFEKEIAATLGDRLAVPAELLDPASSLSIKEGEPAAAINGIAAIGLALSALEPAGVPIDFVNPKKPPVQRNKKQTQMLLAAAASMALLLTVFGVRVRFIRQHTKMRDAVQAQIADEEKKLPIYRKTKLQNKVVTSWIADDQNWLDHLAYLSAVLPGAEDIYVSAFTTSPQHIIRFSVQARTGELLAELDKKLRAAGYEVKPLSITPANDKHGYNFRTTVELAIPKKMKPDLTKAKPPARPADDSSLKAAAAKPDSSRKTT